MEKEPITVKLSKLSEDAKLPERKTSGSAGYDLFSNNDYRLLPFHREWILTGIKISLPKGLFGRILPRSSLSSIYVDTGAGVIDEDYRGEIKVLLINNHQNNIFLVNKGMRIAQMVVEKYYEVGFECSHELDETDRGNNGFGSTGQ